MMAAEEALQRCSALLHKLFSLRTGLVCVLARLYRPSRLFV